MTDAERQTWAGMVTRVTTSLPPGFLALLLINMVFIGMTYWFLNTQIEGRVAMVTKIIDACMTDLHK